MRGKHVLLRLEVGALRIQDQAVEVKDSSSYGHRESYQNKHEHYMQETRLVKTKPLNAQRNRPALERNGKAGQS